MAQVVQEHFRIVSMEGLILIVIRGGFIAVLVVIGSPFRCVEIKSAEPFGRCI